MVYDVCVCVHNLIEFVGNPRCRGGLDPCMARVAFVSCSHPWTTFLHDFPLTHTHTIIHSFTHSLFHLLLKQSHALERSLDAWLAKAICWLTHNIYKYDNTSNALDIYLYNAHHQPSIWDRACISVARPHQVFALIYRYYKWASQPANDLIHFRSGEQHFLAIVVKSVMTSKQLSTVTMIRHFNRSSNYSKHICNYRKMVRNPKHPIFFVYHFRCVIMHWFGASKIDERPMSVYIRLQSSSSSLSFFPLLLHLSFKFISYIFFSSYISSLLRWLLLSLSLPLILLLPLLLFYRLRCVIYVAAGCEVIWSVLCACVCLCCLLVRIPYVGLSVAHSTFISFARLVFWSCI